MWKKQNRSLGIKFPYAWDFDLIRGLAEVNAEADTVYPIEELYCSDPWSLLGTGRPAVALHDRVHDYSSYVAEAHRHGLRFNYLVNAAYLDGREQSPTVLQDLHRHIGQLIDAGVDVVTVANPFLAKRLQGWFPTLDLVGSVNLHLDSVERVRQLLAEVVFHSILLDHRFSRNFGLMKAVRDAFPDLQIAVLVNESCLSDCVYQPYHQNLLAAMSRRERAGDLIELEAA